MTTEQHTPGDLIPTPPVLIVGDVMLDRHVHGHVSRISPEAPVPIVNLVGERCTPGGAGHVAASLVGLGCPVTLAGVIGEDAEADRLRVALAARGVAQVELVARPGVATVCKTRILSDSYQQLLRLDQDGEKSAFSAATAELLARILPRIGGHRAVVVSDYDKGVVTPDLAAAVINRCAELGVPCVVDPKKIDFSIFSGATLLAPNLFETARALGRPLATEEEIERGAEGLRVGLGLAAMLITRGHEGMTLSTPQGNHHTPARTRAVADVTGAGDTVTAVLAACLGAGWDAVEACRLASVAAGIAVSQPGTYVVQAEELEAAWRGASPKVVDRPLAVRCVAEARRAGRRIVFTNGCFDILHAGHLASLEGARALGDFLVVGLNSDSSVKGLKGDSRPIVPERDRARLLGGLACVDLVVIFPESTPADLIEQVGPDVLVKGSDYAGGEIAGADFVRLRGGRVVTLPLVPGLSTTAILARSRGNGPA